ncbi:MAG TPA: RraA family protein [Acetobacteraceae bacterium]|nr:RraA family protein [Acetobacteraceae bacterium]
MSDTLPVIEELRRLLYTPVLSDVLDGFGLMHQALRPFVRPVDDSLVLFGRVRTGRYAAVAAATPGRNPYALEMELIDGLQPGEVPVLACGGPTDVIAPWGELLSTAARARGAAGCLTDGLVRDTARIRAMRFPVFHGGIGPLDTRGRAEMIEKDTTVEIAGVQAAPGDWVMGDVDGVVIIPAGRAEAVFRAALDKIAAEDTTRAELEAGDSLQVVYARHGVL